MNTQTIEKQKLHLIMWISQLQDISLIEKLKEFQEDNFEIPQWHKDIVRERIIKSEDNTDRLLNWDTVKDSFIID